MIDPRTFLALPINFKDKCTIHPPRVIDMLSNEYFSFYKQILCISQEEIEDEVVQKNPDAKEFLTPMEYLLAACYQNEQIKKIMSEGFQFFLKTPVTFLYDLKAILIGDIEEVLPKVKSLDDLVMIREEDYFDFQNALRLAMGEKALEPPNPNEDPRIKRMKAKARYRDKIKAKKGGGLSLQTSLEAICCMGIGLTPLNIGELSYAAIGAIIERYQMKEKYDIDIKSLLAGAKASKVNPVYWIKNID